MFIFFFNLRTCRKHIKNGFVDVACVNSKKKPMKLRFNLNLFTLRNHTTEKVFTLGHWNRWIRNNKEIKELIDFLTKYDHTKAEGYYTSYHSINLRPF